MAKTKKTSKKATGLAPLWTTRWSNLDRVFENFRHDLEKSLSSFPTFQMPQFLKLSEISCDIIDEGSRFAVKVDMPGVKKNEIVLNVTGNSIEISAKHKEEAEEKKKNYLRKERSQLSYFRAIPLPERVVSDKTSAKLTDGVLNITLPKEKPTPKPYKKPVNIQ